jgi:serine/threonine protein kinase
VLLDFDVFKANVLVDRNHRSRLSDFGLTKVLYNTTTAATTLAGSASGTVRWMAPELLQIDNGSGCSQVTVRSDIYALAITIWEVRPAARVCVLYHNILTSLRQLFALKQPFPCIARDIVVPYHVLGGVRPCKPRGCERIGFSEELWAVMKRGWKADPQTRPPLSAFSAVLAPPTLGGEGKGRSTPLARLWSRLQGYRS